MHELQVWLVRTIHAKSPVADLMHTHWAWPIAESLHFIGLCLLFGTVLIVNLRVLGVGKSMVSFTALRQLFPLGMLGLALNLVTGMMFFVATPEQYTGDLFLLKMALVWAGALNLLYFMLGKGHGFDPKDWPDDGMNKDMADAIVSTR